MQMSAALVVEVWLAGAVSLIWITLLVVRIIEPTGEQLRQAFQYVSSVPNLFLMFFAGLAYVIGWSVSYLAETLLDPYFQTRFRDRYFGAHGLDFFEVRSKVFQSGAKDVIADIQYDRQLLRVVRSNIFNFTMLGFVVLSYSIHNKMSPRIVITLTILCELFALVSLLQWRFRYRSTFAKFLDLYAEITGVQCEQGPAPVGGAQRPTFGARPLAPRTQPLSQKRDEEDSAGEDSAQAGGASM